MPLLSFMTTTASTTRLPAIISDKRGNPVTNLTSLKITPIMLPDLRRQIEVKKAIGLEGSVVQVFECFTESHTHIDSSVSVTQIPDIIVGDRLVIGSTTYNIRIAERNSPTTIFGATLQLTITEDRRA